MSINAFWALAAAVHTAASVGALIVPSLMKALVIGVGIERCTSGGMKTPMAWAADLVDRHHAIGADGNGIESGRTPTCPSDAQPPATTVEPGIVGSIPVNSVKSHVDGVFVVGTPPRTRSSRSLIVAAIGMPHMEPTAANEGDRFAQGGRDRGEKLFIGVESHRHTPSP
jgi:hypothetical protein